MTRWLAVLVGIGCLVRTGTAGAQELHCNVDLACDFSGLCEEVDGACAATTDAHCAGSLVCLEEGKCTAANGRCVAAAIADCRQSGACPDGQECDSTVGGCVRPKAPVGVAPPLEGGPWQPTTWTRHPNTSDKVRFRGGISVGAGGVFLNGRQLGAGSVDGRIGVQLGNWFALYAQPQAGFMYGLVQSECSYCTRSAGGMTLSGTVLAEVTIEDRYFLAAGGGALAVAGSPFPYGETLFREAAQLHGRLGGYPVLGYGKDGVRRKGLMVGADVRVIFVDDGPVMWPTLNLGYEAF